MSLDAFRFKYRLRQPHETTYRGNASQSGSPVTPPKQGDVKEEVTAQFSDVTEKSLKQAKEEEIDELEFKPRFDDDDTNIENIPLGEQNSESNTKKGSEKKILAGMSLLRLRHPPLFSKSQSNRSVASSPLASMIHPMNLDLFPESQKRKNKNVLSKKTVPSEKKERNERKEKTEKREKSKSRRRSTADDSSVSSVSSTRSCPVETLCPDILQLEQYTVKSQLKNRRSRLSSSFYSSTKSNHRIAYKLDQGVRSMSKQDLIYSRSFLPIPETKLPLSPQKQATNTVASPRRATPRHVNQDVSVLLLHVPLKIFELVQVPHIASETTVGDVLAKARVNAADPILAEQKYISLCNRSQELAAPMLPVQLLLSSSAPSSDSKSAPRSKKCLLMAVPEGSTAAQVRAIQKILWNTPQIKRMWGDS